MRLTRATGRARGDNLELTVSPPGVSTIVRLLAYRNTARMGIYREALAVAAAGGTVPDIVADDREGRHWTHTDDRLGAAVAVEGLSDPHRDYLAAGGSGFLLGDGRLEYGHEQILELYYRAQLPWPLNDSTQIFQKYPLKIQVSPDFQYIRNPAYNRDRGPVKFWAVRFHLEL